MLQEPSQAKPSQALLDSQAKPSLSQADIYGRSVLFLSHCDKNKKVTIMNNETNNTENSPTITIQAIANRMSEIDYQQFGILKSIVRDIKSYCSLGKNEQHIVDNFNAVIVAPDIQQALTVSAVNGEGFYRNLQQSTSKWSFIRTDETVNDSGDKVKNHVDLLNGKKLSVSAVKVDGKITAVVYGLTDKKGTGKETKADKLNKIEAARASALASDALARDAAEAVTPSINTRDELVDLIATFSHAECLDLRGLINARIKELAKVEKEQSDFSAEQEKLADKVVRTAPQSNVLPNTLPENKPETAVN